MDDPGCTGFKFLNFRVSLFIGLSPRLKRVFPVSPRGAFRPPGLSSRAATPRARVKVLLRVFMSVSAPIGKVHSLGLYN